MTSFNINDFRSTLKYGGARSSLFNVILSNPSNSGADSDLTFKCKTASLPMSSINPIEQSYFGRKVKYPGNRNFQDWTVSIINDEDFKVRNALEHWANDINSLEGNTRRYPSSSPTNYKASGDVIQYGQTGNILRTYRFIGLWPVDIGQIQLSWEADQIEEFDVTFSVDYFYLADNITGDAGGK